MSTEPTCQCPPCPGRGNDGHGMTHCAECCFGSRVDAEPDCPEHGMRTEPTTLAEVFVMHVYGAGSQGRYCRCGAMGVGDRESNHATHLEGVVLAFLAAHFQKPDVEALLGVAAEGVRKKMDESWGQHDRRMGRAVIAAALETLREDA